MVLIQSDEEIQNQLKNILEHSASVIVYRCSPHEKAGIIRYIMTSDKDAFTCAIGDGANDINMIQTAHIGVGIEGNEGNQAAYYADYAIPEFKALRRLMLWHGRSFGYREYTSQVNVIFAGHLFAASILYMNFVNGFSGLNLYEAYYFGLYQIMSTNWYPLVFKIWGMDATYDPEVQASKERNNWPKDRKNKVTANMGVRDIA
jgi:magnesium-transporting ATPase (P-type)